ncbi:MAG: sugar phosphorylase, partial [Caldilineaceae bacterium]|nr:sugar phosphorylase [Caldilineaceae bacterium]
MPTPVERLRAHLTAVYGSAQTSDVLEQLRPRLEAFDATSRGVAQERVSERDVILITYGDQIQEPGRAPLQSLGDALVALTGDFLTGVHILPFYPYTSDDGFSVVDYKAVNPAWGDWTDVQRLGGSFRLMFDAVINHISAESPWFQAFRRGEAPYTSYFITVPPET